MPTVPEALHTVAGHQPAVAFQAQLYRDSPAEALVGKLAHAIPSLANRLKTGLAVGGLVTWLIVISRL